jgi:uncharacterized delta-60 repeat protein
VCRRPVLKTAQRLLLKTAPVAIAASALLVFAPAVAGASTPAGALDPAFGNAGLARLGVSSASLSDVAAYPPGPNAGQILVAGGASAGDPSAGILLARLDSDGNLDQGFGSGGVVVRSVGGDTYAQQVALDSQGRIVVRTDGAVARFNADGTLDDGGGAPGAGFGGCGCGFVRPAGKSVTGIAVTPDDEIVYSANSGTSDQSQAFVGLLRDDGGTSWEKRLSLGANPDVVDDGVSEHANAITAGPSGDLVVAGWFGNPLNPQVGAAELHSDGSFADSFGVEGGQSFDDSQIAAFAHTQAVALDSAGRVILGGIQENSGAHCSGWVTRLTTEGDLDTTFAGDGTHGFSGDRVYEVAADTEDRILASGIVDCHEMYSQDLGVVRLKADGTPDETFGSSGRGQVTQDKPVLNTGYGMAVTDEGIDVVGFVSRSAVVARFLGEESDVEAGNPGGGDDTTPKGGDGGVASELAASPAVDVQQLIAPKRWRKLIKPGIRVLAGCDTDCTVDVTVTVSQKNADAMGIPTAVVARGSAPTAAGGHHWVAAIVPPKIRQQLQSFGGHGRLHVAVTASIPS